MAGPGGTAARPTDRRMIVASPDPVQVEAFARARDEVLGRISAAAARSGRDPAVVTLVAVCKTVSEDRVRDIVRAAHQEFANRPIRDYVPVFVERTAQDELSRLPTD